jgi:hypothetical protein
MRKILARPVEGRARSGYESRERGRSSVAERQLPKLYVVGSIPIARSTPQKFLLLSPPHILNPASFGILRFSIAFRSMVLSHAAIEEPGRFIADDIDA